MVLFLVQGLEQPPMELEPLEPLPTELEPPLTELETCLALTQEPPPMAKEPLEPLTEASPALNLVLPQSGNQAPPQPTREPPVNQEPWAPQVQETLHHLPLTPENIEE